MKDRRASTMLRGSNKPRKKCRRKLLFVKSLSYKFSTRAKELVTYFSVFMDIG